MCQFNAELWECVQNVQLLAKGTGPTEPKPIHFPISCIGQAPGGRGVTRMLFRRTKRGNSKHQFRPDCNLWSCKPREGLPMTAHLR